MYILPNPAIMQTASKLLPFRLDKKLLFKPTSSVSHQSTFTYGE